MEKNIILAGVGGQGILSVAYVLDNAALDAGFHFKQAEVHGMSQRGGAVQSNLRYADHPIRSDLIPRGEADLILAVEPLEVMRYWHYLNPEGWVVSSVTPYINIPDYPEMDELMVELSKFPNIILVDSASLARAAGNMRAQNMVIIGAASILLDFKPEQLLKHVEGLFARKGEKIVAVNRKAFDLGRRAAGFYRSLVEAGVERLQALKLSSALVPESLDASQAGEWAATLRSRPEVLEEITRSEEKISAGDFKRFQA